MTDYGRVVQFGVFPQPVAARLDEILTLVGIADRDGLDLVGIQDHPYQRRYLDTWMLMATRSGEDRADHRLPGCGEPAVAPLCGDGEGGRQLGRVVRGSV